jgi:prepilin-type N-terminal cleavage/methylation domain-containing protein
MRRAQRGYTAVEVMSALMLFAIGATGVIAMQKVTVQGGEDARRFDMATSIANEWVARLQRDSMSWTKPSAGDPTVINLTTDTKWIKDVATCGSWCPSVVPASGSEKGSSQAFDLFGRDMPSGTGHIYCVQYRMNWLVPPGTAPQFNPLAVMRAEVRVVWSRLENKPIDDCASLPINLDAAGTIGKYHFVYTSTAIRENAAR